MISDAKKIPLNSEKDNLFSRMIFFCNKNFLLKKNIFCQEQKSSAKKKIWGKKLFCVIVPIKRDFLGVRKKFCEFGFYEW